MGSHFHPPNSPKKKSGRKFYHQGYFKPTNIDKYIGNINSIVYRSSWELKFMMYCDQNTQITKWSCEHIVIPYQDKNGKYHRYFPDFYIRRIDKNNPDKNEEIIVEIKPFKEIKPDFITPEGGLIPPDMYLKKVTAKALESYEYKLKTYNTNLYKWTKAKDWCDKRFIKFILVHEGILNEMKIL